MSNKGYRPTLAQLRTFVTIAENRHFGAAAAKLNISQPSLSQALVTLEHGLNVQLVERSTRKVIITPIGEELLPYAKAAVESTDALVAHALGSHGMLAGTVTVGIIPTVAPYILPSLLKYVAANFPDCKPCIIEDQTVNLIEMLRDGHIDCGVMAHPIGASGFSEKLLYEEPFTLVVPADHPYAGRRDLTLTDLHDVGVELLLLDDGHCLRDQVINLCHQSDLHVGGPGESTTRASSLATVMRCVAGGLGATLIPASAVPFECSRSDVATATFDPGVTASRSIVLAYRPSSPVAENFPLFGDLITRAYRSVLEPEDAAVSA